MSKIDPAKNPNVERNVRAFLKALNSAGGPPMETTTPAEARQVLVGAQKGAQLPAADVESKTIQQDGLTVKIYIVRPLGSTGVKPAFLFIHGGGWILGDFPTHERFVRDIVVDTGYTAIFVEYTPSPEAQYPTAINEIYAAAKWAVANAAEIRIDPDNFAVIGNSVGGNMSAVTALRASLDGGPKFKAQVLMWPVTNAAFDTGSYDEFEEGYFLTRPMMKWFWEAYIHGENSPQRKEIYASPLQATDEQLKNLPPALVQVAGNDVLRDEGLAYAHKLDGAGVDTTIVRYESLIHDWGLLNPLSTVPAVRDALHQVAEFLRKHLG